MKTLLFFFVVCTKIELVDFLAGLRYVNGRYVFRVVFGRIHLKTLRSYFICINIRVHKQN